MAEYIERDEVQEAMKFVTDDTTCPLHIAAEIDQILGLAPAADVRPERRGEWLVSGDCYECSECGGGSVVNTNPYCWKCGAKMDEEGENNQ